MMVVVEDERNLSEKMSRMGSKRSKLAFWLMTDDENYKFHHFVRNLINGCPKGIGT
jgi:hypothetical protein